MGASTHILHNHSDMGRSALAGALGAIIGETMAEWHAENLGERLQTGTQKLIQEHGRLPTQTERQNLIDQEIEFTQNLGKYTAILTTAMADLDPNIGLYTATNAIDFNFRSHYGRTTEEVFLYGMDDNVSNNEQESNNTQDSGYDSADEKAAETTYGKLRKKVSTTLKLDQISESIAQGIKSLNSDIVNHTLTSFNNAVTFDRQIFEYSLRPFNLDKGYVRSISNGIDDAGLGISVGAVAKSAAQKTGYFARSVGSKVFKRSAYFNADALTKFETHPIHDVMDTPVKIYDVNVNRVSQHIKQLLPGEGRVGTYGELIYTKKTNQKSLAAHHIPNYNYIKARGIKKNEGIAITIEHNILAPRGRHGEIHKSMVKQNIDLAPRDALAQSIQRARTIYQNDGLYTSEIRQSLQQVIKLNKEKFPNLFKE